MPNLTGLESQYLQECISSTYVSSVGPFVSRFEAVLSMRSGSAATVAVASGTTGLHLALVGIGVKPEDLVIVPSLTFIATANAVSMCGASPWLFDVCEDSWTLDPLKLADELRRSVVRQGGRTIHKASGRPVKAVLPVFTLGMPADMDTIGGIAHEFELEIVADAAAALGATYKGREIGGLARISVASFNGNKTFTCGGGGAIFGHDVVLLDRLRHLASTARVGDDYSHDAIAYNYRMPNINAAVGVAQLERFSEFVAAKRRSDTAYRNLANDLEGASGFPHVDWAESACWLSGLVLDRAHDRNELVHFLNGAGVEARPFWKPIHRQAPYRNALVSDVSFTDSLWQRVVTLPSSTNLTKDDLDRIGLRVREWFP